MAEIGFYHLTRSTLEQALPRLLERTLQSGKRAVVIVGSAERAETLASLLWTADPDSFLPHGSRADGSPEDQPVFLTDREDYPNGAQVLALVDGAEADPAPFRRCLYLFDGNDEQAVARVARFRIPLVCSVSAEAAALRPPVFPAIAPTLMQSTEMVVPSMRYQLSFR